MDSSVLNQSCDLIVQSIDLHAKKFKGFGWFSHFGSYGKNNSTLKRWRKQCEDAVKAQVAVLKSNISYYFNQFQISLNQKNRQIAQAKQSMKCLTTWNQQNIKQLQTKCSMYQADSTSWSKKYAALQQSMAKSTVASKQSKNQLEGSRSIIESLESQLKRNQQEKKKLQENIKQWEKKNSSLMINCKNQHQLNELLQKKLKQLETKLVQWQPKNQKSEKQLEELRANLKHYKQQCAIKEKQNQEKSEEINRLIDQLERFSEASNLKFQSQSISSPTQFNDQSPFWKQQEKEEENQFQKLPQVPIFEINEMHQDKEVHFMDSNNDGKISKEEYLSVLTSWGYPDNQENRERLDKIFQEYGVDGFIPNEKGYLLDRCLSNSLPENSMPSAQDYQLMQQNLKDWVYANNEENRAKVNKMQEAYGGNSLIADQKE